MTDIYDQHTAAFKNVSAYVVLKDGKRIATIAFKFPADGAGRLFCYAHIFGLSMVRGSASGCGYDKRSAAVESAIERVEITSPDETTSGHAAALKAGLADGSGWGWQRGFEEAGFTVYQAV